MPQPMIEGALEDINKNLLHWGIAAAFTMSSVLCRVRFRGLLFLFPCLVWKFRVCIIELMLFLALKWTLFLGLICNHFWRHFRADSPFEDPLLKCGERLFWAYHYSPIIVQNLTQALQWVICVWCQQASRAAIVIDGPLTFLQHLVLHESLALFDCVVTEGFIKHVEHTHLIFTWLHTKRDSVTLFLNLVYFFLDEGLVDAAAWSMIKLNNCLRSSETCLVL